MCQRFAHNSSSLDANGKQQHAPKTGTQQTRDGWTIDLESWDFHWQAKVIQSGFVVIHGHIFSAFLWIDEENWVSVIIAQLCFTQLYSYITKIYWILCREAWQWLFIFIFALTFFNLSLREILKSSRVQFGKLSPLYSQKTLPLLQRTHLSHPLGVGFFRAASSRGSREESLGEDFGVGLQS